MRISIRSKLLLATLATLVLLTALTLVFMNSDHRISADNRMLRARSDLLCEMGSLEQAFLQMLAEENPELLAGCLGHASTLESIITILESNESLFGDAGVANKSDQVHTALDRLISDLRLPSGAGSAQWIRARTDMLVLGSLVHEFDSLLAEHLAGSITENQVRLGVVMALGILLIGCYYLIFSNKLNKSFGKILTYTRSLQEGILPPPLVHPTADEFGQIAGHLNTHTSGLQKKIAYITALSQEGPVSVFTPEAEDELGNSLVKLSDTLTRKELEEVTRNREDKKQNWISEGVAQLGEVLRSESENVKELSFTIIQKLVQYMNVEMGSLFITGNEDPENLFLELAASYAYDRRKYQSGRLEWGVGLPGTCAQEKKRIFLTDVPDTYFEISSGTGSARPNCLLLVPMIINDEVSGVIELATVRLLRPFEIQFVESLAERIASSLLTVQTNERTKVLLEQSQAQAQTLRTQEAILIENMKQLEKAQAESGKKEREISGILNAMNQSTLMAELGLNGRYTEINDRFLQVLESHRDQVLGKKHSEFAQVDSYAEAYKSFWSTLKEGGSVSNTEMYKLFSGKEVWLRQTFTPITNEQGRVYKILNIAEDITATRSLQEKLESRNHEITRGHMEMQTLNAAVNSALIKCELDADGIIMEVNEKYTEVTGYGRKELLGRNYRLFLKEPEKEQFEKIWQEVSKQKVYEGVIRRSRPTGEEAWLVSTFSPVISEAGVIYKVYFMGLDITEKKLKYQLLEDANQEIERLRERLKDYES
ncbi:MAG: PAS domain S-box protein [Bacteroidota bacterium]